MTHENIFSETKLAQCFYLLHGSKADYTQLSPEIGIRELNFLLIQFSSINTATSLHNMEIFKELSNIFLTVVKNDKITTTIWQTVEEIASIPNIFFDFSKIKLIFFDCGIKDLYGFSGKNRLYINTIPFKEFFNYNLSQSKKNILIKLNFLSLVLHEIGHILLRFKLNDLNVSSPFLSRIKDNHENVKKNVWETGQEVEKKFFKDCIDWFSSVHNINEEYCEEYLKLILNNQFVQFDAKQAGVFTIKEDVLQKMSFSYRIRRKFYRF
ncbi:hypothetical protein BpHYR1_049855 [Brachionus plicatilis]|uniref:Uncharacterized protein n=1 Tax=Brachionus plicatilis TaxID=10195 RepID=A0A3M7SAJ5_BRAPC|nr:hypothetical protein BpHYR1_049855 [Brachionus plicatilis]